MKNWWSDPISALDQQAAEQASARQAELTKPPRSLGRLESVAIQLASMQGVESPVVEQVWITIFAADHGVASLGVSAFPQDVTAEMVRNFSRGGAAIAVLAKQLGATLEVVNVGTVSAIEPLPQVLDARVAAGTRSFVSDAAMDHSHLEQAMAVGRDAVMRAQQAGADLYIGGEMGIGNSTAAAAVAAALLKQEGRVVAGVGTGVDVDGVSHKSEVIQQALDFHHDYLNDPLEVLRRLGGFEVAALSGSYIAAAQQRLPILVDGFISSVAALLATRIQPDARQWMLFSHRSAEQGHQRVLEAMQAEPLLDLGMRLGEGSGAAVALPLLQQACQLHREMATFAEASVSQA